MRALVLRFLLHRANSRPPNVARREFYALKDRLLTRYAVPDGFDVQELRKECWGYYYEDGCRGPSCSKCGGTGVFETVFVKLDRYRWGPYVSHRPVDRSWRVPCLFGEPTIRGRVRHRDYGRSAAEATLWLYVLTGSWALLARELRSTRRYGWWLWPLLNLQRVVFEVRMYPQRRRRRENRRWTATIVSQEDESALPF